MTKPTIAIDIDDVIADTTEALRLAANKIPGVQLEKEHYLVEGSYWGYYESVWKNNDVDHIVSFDNLHTDMVVDQSHIELIKGAKDALLKLSKNYRLVLVTSRETSWVEATRKWVEQNLPDMVHKVIFVYHKNADGRTKGDACIEVGAEFLVDDNPEHCESALEKGVKVILFGNYGWSRSAKSIDGCIRAKNWQEVMEYFDEQG